MSMDKSVNMTCFICLLFDNQNKKSFFEGTNCLFPYYPIQSVSNTPSKHIILLKKLKCTQRYEVHVTLKETNRSIEFHLFFILKHHE